MATTSSTPTAPPGSLAATAPRLSRGAEVAFRPATALWVAVTLLAAGLASLSFDLQVASWLLEGGFPKELHRLLALSEVFAHGTGVAMLLIVIYTLDPHRRAALPRIIACSLGAGLAANCVKLLVSRTRPHHLPDAFDFSGSVLGTFNQWLPLLSGGSGMQSFPSAHAATAAGFAVVLAWLYPRGRWLFAVLALLGAMQRLEASAHFLSDTLLGAALGCLVAGLCIHPLAAGGWFDRLDQGAPPSFSRQ